MNRIFITFAIAIVVFLCFIFFNFFNASTSQIKIDAAPKSELKKGFQNRLSDAISIETVSFEDKTLIDTTAFLDFNEFLAVRFPFIDSLLMLQRINTFSSIYKWSGNNPDLKPVILLAHIDVVPVPDNNLTQWAYPPFDGKVADDKIWGRGAIDDKNSVLGLMEAVENMLLTGYKPERSVYLCFGHDEEIGGKDGAKAIVEYLQADRIEAEFILDEGYAITEGLIPGIDKPVALIGTSEKGFVTLNLSVNLPGGHSSMPLKETAIDVLARAVAEIKSNPFPPYISAPVKDFMDRVGPEMTFMQKLAFSNIWLFKPLIFNIYEAKASGNAIIRTTTSPTIFKAGIKDNVIPYQAKAVINFRTLPGTSFEDVRNRILELIDDDRIKVEFGGFVSESPEVSSVDSFGYSVIEKSIKEVYGDLIVAPNLVIAATDARHYSALSKNIYRFAPFRLTPQNVDSFHGINESIGIPEYEEGIQFYIRLIQNSTMNQN